MAKMTRGEWIESTLAEVPEGAAERFWAMVYGMTQISGAQSPSPLRTDSAKAPVAWSAPSQ